MADSADSYKQNVVHLGNPGQDEDIIIGRRAFLRVVFEVEEAARKLGAPVPFTERVAFVVSERRHQLRRQLGKE